MTQTTPRPLTEALASGGDLLLQSLRCPEALLRGGAPAGAPVDASGSASVDMLIKGGRIAALEAPGRLEASACTVDLGGRHVWPMLIDAHTHLDKGHVLGRAPDSGGTHAGAREATTQDRIAHWRHDDLIRRMDFGLSCAEAHGVAAIRTHLDSHEGQGETTWGAFAETREAWKDRIALQAVALVPLDAWGTDYAPHLADLVARHGGLIGGVTRASGGTHGSLSDIDALLDRLFTLARERDLDIDLHVDEAAEGGALSHVARAAIRHGYEGRVTCGHCCSLARLPEDEMHAAIALVKEAGLSLITLPTVNMYLQDRVPGRTPRWRGVMPLHELREAGVPVAVAGDNCRDPFYAYGDHDMLDTWREAVRICHLDHPLGAAAALAGPAPAGITGHEGGSLGVGQRADLMVLEAWSMDQVIARPQSDRLLLRAGKLLDVALPSYAALDLVPAAHEAA
ncbi:cytosine deaminase [Salipiger sp. PrR002]|uniref:cytosine deaminase n=1 Tax=Salipiger sp. PrR002 TaxID=2706489 RepID=UPI0013B8811C|nr:cytosine deaminase [Salipiger sp. PrR002]NDW00036.1 cytosine deaminase [Salipiger sp. PrR002]NDW56172.1 cytosine deaminase [Salipiger sp. PrR004]